MFSVVGLKLSSSLVPYNTHDILRGFASFQEGSMPCSTGFIVIFLEILQAVCLLKNYQVLGFISLGVYSCRTVSFLRSNSWRQVLSSPDGHFELIDVWLHHWFVPLYYFWVFPKVCPAARSAHLGFHWSDASPMHVAFCKAASVHHQP